MDRGDWPFCCLNRISHRFVASTDLRTRSTITPPGRHPSFKLLGPIQDIWEWTWIPEVPVDCERKCCGFWDQAALPQHHPSNLNAWPSHQVYVRTAFRTTQLRDARAESNSDVAHGGCWRMFAWGTAASAGDQWRRDTSIAALQRVACGVHESWGGTKRVRDVVRLGVSGRQRLGRRV
jgi:hypothetical protein